MKRLRQPFLTFFCLAALPATWACSIKLAGLDAPVHAPPTLSPSEDKKLSGRYADTQCMEFHVEKRKLAAGFLCSSTNTEFMNDFGISQDSGNTVGAMTQSQGRSYRVNTPMSSYEMPPIKVGNRNLYRADVDCDEANGPIYRATSTCNVAFMPLEGGRFLYSNFVLENHIDSSKVVKQSDIQDLWKNLKISN